MSDLPDYEVMVELEEMVNEEMKKKKKFAVALCIAGTYHPETNSVVLAAVCKDTDIPISSMDGIEITLPATPKDVKISNRPMPCWVAKANNKPVPAKGVKGTAPKGAKASLKNKKNKS